VANIIGLALKVTGDASGLAKSLTPVDRALDRLAQQAERATNVFTPFAEKTAAAGKAQEEFAEKFSTLADQLREKVIGPQEYAAAFGQLTQEAKAAAKAFEEGLRITEQVRTSEERRAAELEKIDKLLAQGAISEETATRARAAATNEAERLAKVEADLAAAREEAARIIEANLTASEKAQIQYNEAVAKAQQLAEQKLLTDEQLNSEIERQAQILQKAGEAQFLLSDAQKKADEIIAATRTDLEKFIEKQQEYQQLLNDGLLPLENYTRAVQEAAAGLNSADLAAASEASGVSLDTVSTASGEAATNTQNLGDALRILPGFMGGFVTSATDFVNNASQIAERMDRLTRLLGDFAAVVPLAARAVGFLVTPIGAAAAAVAVSGGVAAGLSRMEEAAQRLTNTANKLGVSFAFIETLQQAARVTGVSFETVNAATTRLLRSLANADEDSNKAAAALNKLGISLDAIRENDTEGTIRSIADRLVQIEDPAKRATAAVAIFGKSGAELLPFLSSLREAEDTLNRFNARLSTLDRDRVLSLGESFNTVGAALRGVGNEALTPFIGAAQAIADGLAPVITEFGRTIGTVLDLLSPFTSALGAVVNVFGQLIGIGLKGINLFFEPLAIVFRGLSAVVESVSKGITAFFKSISPVAETARAAIRRNAQDSVELAKSIQDAIGKGNQSIGDAIKRAGEFGQSGFVAAQQFQRAVARLNVELKDIGAKEYAIRLADATAEFDKQLVRAKEIRTELDRALRTEQERRQATSSTADEILRQTEAQKEQNRLLAFTGGDAAQAQAIERRTALEQELFRVQEQAIAARATNDLDAAAAADARIVKLREAIGFEQQRIDGEKTALDIESERLTKESERRKRVEEILKLRVQETDIAQKLAGVEASLVEARGKAEIEQARAQAEVQRVARDNTAATQEDFLKILTNPALTKAQETVRDLTATRKELLDQQAASDQGFGEGFANAFAETDKLVTAAIQKTKEFGKQGSVAAQAFESGIKQAQAEAGKGILTKPTFDQEVARIQELFNKQVTQLEQLKAKQIQDQRDIFDAKIAANQRVEEFLKRRIDDRTKAELSSLDAVAKRQQQARENDAALADRIKVTQDSLNAAREVGDLKSARARAGELKALKQAQLVEQKIAQGRGESARTQVSGLARSFNRVEQFQGLVAQSNDRFLKSFTDTFGAANASLAAANAAAAELARQQELLRPVAGAVATADIRTAEGAALVLGLGAAAQDPNLIEAKLQTKALTGIRTAITNAVAGYLNTPVEIF
jgi:hypothetical protein